MHGLAQEGEDIRVVVKTVAEIETMLDAGAVDTGHTLIGLYWLVRHRDRLRRQWAAAPAPRLENVPANRERLGPATKG